MPYSALRFQTLNENSYVSDEAIDAKIAITDVEFINYDTIIIIEIFCSIG